MSSILREAERRIDLALKRDERSLNLSGLGLSEVPQRIRLLTGLVKLDLGYNRITELPGFIGEFHDLRNLILQGNELTDLPIQLGDLSRLSRLQLHSNRLTDVAEPLGRLVQLERLVLGGNQIESLPSCIQNFACLNFLDLYGNRLTELPPEIAALRSLTDIDLGSNHLASIPEAIGECTGLTRINLSGNHLREIPGTLGGLHSLTHLDLSANRLTALPDALGGLALLTNLDLYGNELDVFPASVLRLRHLTHLDLSDNRLVQIPEAIGDLEDLVTLNLHGNRLTDLPPRLGRSTALRTLVLDDNDFPPEIEAASAQGVHAVLAFLRELAVDTVAVREAKLVLLGEGQVGKTSLLAAMRGEPFVEHRPLTHGLEVKPLRLTADAAGPLTLNAWDFGGQAVGRPTHQLFFTSPALYVVAWNPRVGAAQGSVEYWIDLVRRRVGDDVRIHVVATHADTDDQLGDLDEPRLRREHGDCIAGFHRIDSSTGRGVAGLADALAATASRLPHVDRRLPARWRALLEELNASGKSHLTFAEYSDRAKAHGLDADSARALAQVATELGHWCHFPEIKGLGDLVVLQADWLSRAVSLALNDPVTRDRGGLVSHSRLAHLWSDPSRPEHERYPVHLHPALIRLMHEFQIAYRIRDSRNGPTSLITRLVPSVEPELPDWEQYGEALPEQSYVIEFRDARRRRVVPEGLVFRLIAWFHRFALERGEQGRGVHWASGMILDDGGHGRALVRVEGERLTVTVKAAYPTYLCKVIANDVCNYLSDWKGLSPATLVPCDTACAAEGRPEAHSMRFDLARLQRLKADGRFAAACAECYEQVPVDALIGEFGAIADPVQQLDGEVAAAVHARLDSIEALIDAQAASTRTHFTAESNLLATQVRTQIEEQAQQYLGLFADEGARGPRLFTLEPAKQPSGLKRLAQQRVRVILWCEHSRQPVHVLDGDPAKGVYMLDIDKEWLSRARPLIVLASRLLRLGGEFVPSVLKLGLEDDRWKEVEAGIGLAATAAKELASNAADYADRSGTAMELDQSTRFDERTRGEIRLLHEMLEQRDPDFAGLRRVRDRGRFLWVHSRFAGLYE
ncbi:leucine-rich repeat domain-containing protein [Glycomyces sp. MUSA5-2]|uniref:leucine-rich repeat domain-containing protein n=1 Tax=Glycomyces sp. MUSA5-2 TaxID=2053002 RepID=UPI00300BDE02